MNCVKTNKICNRYYEKCESCVLDNPINTCRITDYEEYMREKQEKEEFEKEIPKECKKCTLLEKDFIKKTVRCLYRSGEKCILKQIIKD